MYKDDTKAKFNLGALFCGMAVYMCTYNYYSYIFKSFEEIFLIIYQIFKLCFIGVFIWQICLILTRKIKCNKKSLPYIYILLFVVLNIIIVIIKSQSIAILTKDYQMKLAEGTNDEFGYYFSIITLWLANCGIGLWLANNIKNEKELNHCILVSIKMIIIPIILLILLHPEMIGKRESMLNDINFGGGIWNIGVFAFGSIAWLAIAQINNMSKKNRILVIIGIVIIIFAGIVGLSRTLILMIGVSFLYYFIKMKKTKNTIFNIMIIGIVLAVISIVLLSSKESILSSLIGRMTDDTSGKNNVRIYLWQQYLLYWKDYFLFGAPLGGAYNYYVNINYEGFHFLPHSSIINFLIMGGVGCLLSYLVLLKNIFTGLKLKNHKTRNTAVCLKAWIIEYCILAFMNQTGFSQIIFYMAFGLGIALIEIKSNIVEEKQLNENRNNY